MKLKAIQINSYLVLVDESAEIIEKNWVIENEIKQIFQVQDINKINGLCRSKVDTYVTDSCSKILFAEKELNLDVPVLPNWREWEIEQLAEQKYPITKGGSMWMPTTHDCNQANKQEGFIAGYNHNKKLYTEEDLEKAYFGGGNFKDIEEWKYFKKSLQKYPKYIVMESNTMNKGYSNESDKPYQECEIPKLITNSEGKQIGIIKEIIW